MTSDLRLDDLRREFRATSTKSMPIAGMIFWAIVGVAALFVRPVQLGYLVGFGSGMIFPLAILIDRVSGGKVELASTDNPVTQMFMQSLALVALMWPMVIIAAVVAHDPILVVLGGAILMGIIWIPYGWAADDPVGIQHAIGRCILVYAAYLFVSPHYKATAISVAVLLSYAYTLVRMRRG